MKKHLLSAMFVFTAIVLQAQTIYVKTGATGSGSSWADACDLETAVSNAIAGSEIWIEKGTYYPAKMLSVPRFTKLYGGFSGTEMSLYQRDVENNPTIIDAQQKIGSVVYMGEYSELNGLVIQNGYANDNPYRNGGGVYAEDNTIIENCQIINNSAIANGGGIYAHNNLTLLNSIVENNTADNLGNNVYGCCVMIEGSSNIPPFICNVISTMNYVYTQGTAGAVFGPLTISAIGSSDLSYQWYSNTAKSTVGGKPVGTNSPSFTPPTIPTGALYYYVVVSNAYGKDTSNVSGLYTVNPLNFDYTGAAREFTLQPGTYVIQCWGAQGGTRLSNGAASGAGSMGGYSSGTILVEKPTTFYAFVGQAGKQGSWSSGRTTGYGGAGGWNGGATGGGDGGNSTSDDVGGGGGGGTDVRLISGAWNNATSLRSRIIVAGGGGGGPQNGWGGGLTGGVQTGAGAQATQTSGYAFGSGQTGGYGGDGHTGKGGGGGGWYGGGSRSSSGSAGTGEGGNGGSGFISGHPGCNAVNENGSHRGNPTHYSGVVFTGTVMTSGNASMPNPRGSGNIIGNSGNGYVRITRIK